jgi:hypothetical protein
MDDVSYVPVEPHVRSLLLDPRWADAFEDWEDVFDTIGGLAGMYSATYPRPLHPLEPAVEWRSMEDALRRLAGTPFQRHACLNAAVARRLWRKCEAGGPRVSAVPEVDAYLDAMSADTMFLTPRAAQRAA